MQNPLSHILSENANQSSDSLEIILKELINSQELIATAISAQNEFTILQDFITIIGGMVIAYFSVWVTMWFEKKKKKKLEVEKTRNLLQQLETEVSFNLSVMAIMQKQLDKTKNIPGYFFRLVYHDELLQSIELLTDRGGLYKKLVATYYEFSFLNNKLERLLDLFKNFEVSTNASQALEDAKMRERKTLKSYIEKHLPFFKEVHQELKEEMVESGIDVLEPMIKEDNN